MSVEIFDKAGRAIAAETLTFSGGERHVQLDPAQIHKIPAPRSITIRARITSSDEIFDLLLICDAIFRIDAAVRFHIEIPYLPYARQDRVCAPGQAYSLEVIARVFGTIANVEQLTVWDCHSPAGLAACGAINIDPADIVRCSSVLSDLLHDPDSVLICPDKGAIERTNKIAKALKTERVAYASKTRDPRTGAISETTLDETDLNGKTAIITDDICDGGYTFILLAKALKARGVRRVVLYVTHGIFSRGLNVFDGLIDQIFTTNSFTNEVDERLHVIAFQAEF